MDNGLIFDIERMSTKDGTGIRSVIFFKGCNMRCKWCHNPEGIGHSPQLIFNAAKCIACGKCSTVCHNGCHVIEDNKHSFFYENCDSCLKCTSVCYTDTLKAVGREVTVENIIEEILPDMPLYRKTNGGITLTGGEVMMQPEFATALACKAKDLGIGVCIETNLSVSWSCYEKILPYLDIIYADIKHINCEKHKQYTGIENTTILANLERLKRCGKHFVIRTPIIPGFNDEIQEIQNIAGLLSDAENLDYYELLTYNPLGFSKGLVVNAPDIVRYNVPEKDYMVLLSKAVCNSVPVRLDGKWVKN